MKRIILLSVPTILVIYLVGTVLHQPRRIATQSADATARLVSLSPSITECLFTLGLGDKVVGVTDWCRWPSSARDVTSVGGHVDPNLEAVLALAPDLVILERANAPVIARLADLGLPTLVVEHRHLTGILDSFLEIGEACGAREPARRLHDELALRLAALDAVAGPRVRTLVVVGRDVSSGRLRDVIVAGRGTFLDELLEAAGGVNACEVDLVSYPSLSRESIMTLAPEVIIDLAPEFAGDPEAVARLLAAWRVIETPAAREQGVHIFTDDAMLIPGPRVVTTVEQFAAALQPRPAEATN